MMWWNTFICLTGEGCELLQFFRDYAPSVGQSRAFKKLRQPRVLHGSAGRAAQRRGCPEKPATRMIGMVRQLMVRRVLNKIRR
jgi:hypothetical protein